MGEVIAKLCDGKEVQMYSKFNIGDYVKVVHTGHQYSSYNTAFKFFWGDTDRYKLPYSVGEYENDVAFQAAMARMPQRWKIINMAVHDMSPDIILYHIRSEDGKNCVVSAGAIKLIDFHHRNREPIGKLMIYQLPLNGNVMKHKWTDKLYKIIK
jgi:hypothetical protein